MFLFLLTVSNYIESPAEKEWNGEIVYKICEIAKNQSQINSMKLALDHDPHHLSYIDKEPIEPLTAIGRHPFANVGCRLKNEVNKFDISHIILANRCNKQRKPIVKFFDMGCTIFKPVKHASASGPSIPLFMNLYNNTCLEFDEIWGWEVRKHNNWWENVPLITKPRIHFYNTPVNALEFKFALSICSVSDFVVIKLDIDNTIVEMEIIKVIEEYAHLVDELFFEYHYYFDGLNFGWGNLNHIKGEHNATTAITLMRKLRKKGIRAHFWI